MNDSHSMFETLLASTIHDMKNSLSLVLSELDNIGNRLDPADENKKSLTNLRYEASKINVTLMKLLSLYKLEKKHLSVQISEVLLVDLIEDSIAGHAALAQSRGISLSHDCDDELIWFVDPNLISIVLDNVISNSIRYSKSQVMVSAGFKDGLLQLDIEDDGNGYPEAMMLEPEDYVKRVDYATGSTGLGLYFAAMIAHSHQRQGRHGSIQLSNLNRLAGGCFRLLLP